MITSPLSPNHRLSMSPLLHGPLPQAMASLSSKERYDDHTLASLFSHLIFRQAVKSKPVVVLPMCMRIEKVDVLFVA